MVPVLSIVLGFGLAMSCGRYPGLVGVTDESYGGGGIGGSRQGGMGGRTGGAGGVGGGTGGAGGGVQCRTSADCNQTSTACRGPERCEFGRCIAPPAIQCNDGVACTLDRCDPERGCVFVPDDMACPATSFCSTTAGCVSLGCMNDLQCDDRNACNGKEFCHNGRCIPSPPMSCDDGIDCTIDVCDLNTGCINRPDNSRCPQGATCVTGVGCLRDNLCDVDGDGWPATECGGKDCNDIAAHVNPGVIEICGNAIDDDCNGRADCQDSGCTTSLICCRLQTEICGDGRDNNCDDRADCQDPQCAVTPACGMCLDLPEVCRDGRDNDCDGLADCADHDCAFDPVCRRCSPEICRDGRDNDCDDLTDCRDPDCAGQAACTFCWAMEICGNAIDDDCNGHADCQDPQCATLPACLVDCTRVEEFCRDGRDNDCDGLNDCQDSECAGNPLCLLCSPVEVGPFCATGFDEDCDGLIDCDDPNCRTSAYCRQRR